MSFLRAPEVTYDNNILLLIIFSFNYFIHSLSYKAFPRLDESIFNQKNSGAPLLLQDSSVNNKSTSGSTIENRLVAIPTNQGGQARPATGVSNSLIAAPVAGPTSSSSSSLVMKRDPIKIPTPKWHAPWELSAVVSGHLGWVRSIAFDPSNEWFATGSADRTIKIWYLDSF